MKLRLSLAAFILLSLSRAFAGGGAFEGGGGLGEDEQITYEAFVLEIQEIVAELPRVFQRVETAPEIPDAILAKLFRGERTVYQALQGARLRFPMGEPCYDPLGKAVPASALVNGEERVLCFSHALLSTRIERPKFYRHMVGIATHEASHLVRGIEEAEARLLEKLVRLRL